MTDLFREKAEDWDTNDRRSRLAAAISASILERVPLRADMNVLDFGAGTGLISARIAPRVDRIVAADTSQAMLQKLEAKPELQSRVSTVCRDILDDPLDERFDLIVSAMAMHHVEDTARLMQTFAEHLKDSGMVALADLDKEDGSFHPADTQGVFHQGFDRDELRALMQRIGFDRVEFHTAHTVNGDAKDYPIFLVTAMKGSSASPSA
jgi:predicted TPR repeat methyltransferase